MEITQNNVLYFRCDFHQVRTILLLPAQSVAELLAFAAAEPADQKPVLLAALPTHDPLPAIPVAKIPATGRAHGFYARTQSTRLARMSALGPFFSILLLSLYMAIQRQASRAVLCHVSLAETPYHAKQWL